MFTQISCVSLILPKKIEYRSTPCQMACSTARPNTICSISKDKCICTWSLTVTPNSIAIITFKDNNTKKPIIKIFNYRRTYAAGLQVNICSRITGERLQANRNCLEKTQQPDVWYNQYNNDNDYKNNNNIHCDRNAVMNNSNKPNKPNNWTICYCPFRFQI